MMEKVSIGKRLAYLFKERFNEDFWSENWSEEEIAQILSLDQRTAIGEYHKIFTKYLEKKFTVIEAGCGPSRYLYALMMEGYECVGIDNSLTLLLTVKKYRKDLPLAAMDVRKTAFSDNAVGGYISLGVMEHFFEGMEQPLLEARRILRPGGIILVSVPYFNPFRRRLADKGRYRKILSEKTIWKRFYQFAFTQEEFCRIVSNCDYEILDVDYFSVIKGLRDEIPSIRGLYRFYNKLLNRSKMYCLPAKGVGSFLKVLESFARLPSIKKRVSHMIMVIARKPLEK